MKINSNLWAKAVLVKLVKLTLKNGIISERNAGILEDIVSDASIDNVCKKYSLSSARVYQIFSSKMHFVYIFILEQEKRKLALEEDNSKLTAEVSLLNQKIKDLENSNNHLEEELSAIREIEASDVSKDENYNRKAFSILIKNTRLSVRALCMCRAADINNLGELMNCTAYDLIRFRNCGKKTLKEIREMLDSYGLKLKEE
jgi:predicted RNase H-like nuclease (RuvC/YqgF family)